MVMGYCYFCCNLVYPIQFPYFYSTMLEIALPRSIIYHIHYSGNSLESQVEERYLIHFVPPPFVQLLVYIAGVDG